MPSVVVHSSNMNGEVVADIDKLNHSKPRIPVEEIGGKSSVKSYMGVCALQRKGQVHQCYCERLRVPMTAYVVNFSADQR